MKTLVLLSLLLVSAKAMAYSTWGESVHCEKGIFLSDNNAVLDIILNNDTGPVKFIKAKADGTTEAYFPAVMVRKSFFDTTHIEITDLNNGSSEDSKFKLALKFKKLINAETLEYTADLDYGKKSMGGLKCTVQPIEIQ